jgi:hypothetical protein
MYALSICWLNIAKKCANHTAIWWICRWFFCFHQATTKCKTNLNKMVRASAQIMMVAEVRKRQIYWEIHYFSFLWHLNVYLYASFYPHNDYIITIGSRKNKIWHSTRIWDNFLHIFVWVNTMIISKHSKSI